MPDTATLTPGEVMVRQRLATYFHKIARYAEAIRPDAPIIDEFVAAHSDLLNRFAARVLEGK